MKAKEIVSGLAEKAGISLNGDRPWDMRVHDSRAYDFILHKGTLGLGESYMLGWWDCERIDELVVRALKAHVETALSKNIRTLAHNAAMRFFNLQSVSRAPEVAERHYNADKKLFMAMLDPYMQYSCGYWKNTNSLEKAQQAKMELICAKLGLKPGMKVLDIGCGWGGLARYMAGRYGVSVTGINLSTEQLDYAREKAGQLPVEYKLLDYRRLSGKWDRIVSVGMFEHVGPRNYSLFFNTVKKCLKSDGLFLLHTIGGMGGRDSGADPWLEKYIFPNSILPSAKHIAKAVGTKFVMEDWHNFGADYDKTAMAWYRNFENGYKNNLFDCSDKYRRMFDYYLCSCAGAFRERAIHAWQIVFSPEGVTGGYVGVR